MRRVWTYSRHSWDGWHPMIGHDEYGYRTILLTAPGLGALVFRAWKCRDAECIADTHQQAVFMLTVTDDDEFYYSDEELEWARRMASA